MKKNNRQPTDYYICLKNKILFNPELSPHDIVVFCCILTQIYKHKGYCSITQKQMAFMLNINVDSVCKSINKLKKLNMISTYKIPHQPMKIFIKDDYFVHPSRKNKTTETLQQQDLSESNNGLTVN